MRIQTRQQGRARGAATPGVIELREADTVGGETIKILSREFTAVTTDIGESHVIRENDDNVRLVGRVEVAGSDNGHAADESGTDDFCPGEKGDEQIHEIEQTVRTFSWGRPCEGTSYGCGDGLVILPI
jgi:hypothetical protein